MTVRRSVVFPLAALLALAAIPLPAHAAGRAKHVLIVVMDGLRRDAVVEADMPTLSALAKSGTFFAAHHPVYLSTTEVNGTALATGMAPAHSGIMANREYRPDVELLRPVDTQGQWAAWKGDSLGNAAWINTPTLPELARAAGMTTAVAGTKGVAMMWDRRMTKRTVASPTLFEGKTIPSSALDGIQGDLGPMPPGVDWKLFTNFQQDTWTVKALTEKLWADGVPNLSVLWLSEPDFSQHGTGPGSPLAKAALRSSDDRLATALKALEAKGVRDQTDVFVVSDHGFSTIGRKIDVADRLRKAKFKAETQFKKAPEPGSVMIVSSGATMLFYVIGHDAKVKADLIDYLQKSSWAGVIFTQDGGPGLFKFADAGIGTPNVPDVVVAMRWKDEPVKDHMPGSVVNDGMDVGQGMHGSLSKYDMGNTLIAAGPDIKKGLRNALPSANSDVAPTIASILGLTPAKPMDGRVLTEALTDGPASNAKPETKILTAEKPLGDDKTWSQYLKVTTYENRRYYDEGNAGAPPTAQPAPATRPTK